jgi:hypothetical protein
MTYYRKQRMESFKKAMFASRFGDRYIKPSLPPQPRSGPGGSPRHLAS